MINFPGRAACLIGFVALAHGIPRRDDWPRDRPAALDGTSPGLGNQAAGPAIAAGILAVNTWPWPHATSGAFEELAAGHSAVSAVEAGCAVCEREQCDGTVGFGGSPDSEGEVTLDALIMDGSTFNVGAVGCLRRVKNAIGVARAVLEHTTHSLLVGDKAARFAEMAGFAREDLNTSRSEALDAAWRAQACQPSFFVGFADQDDSCPPYHLPSGPRGPPAGTGRAAGRGESFWVGRDNHDTIGMVARDKRGRFAAGTSSNGASHKVAGRVGDAAIAGAGAYADDAGGGAAATGDGDVMMRFMPTFRAVSPSPRP